MTTEEILLRLEAMFGFEPEDGNLMLEGRSNTARLSISHKAAIAIIDQLENANA
jgi:hypothetical protein